MTTILNDHDHDHDHDLHLAHATSMPGADTAPGRCILPTEVLHNILLHLAARLPPQKNGLADPTQIDKVLASRAALARCMRANKALAVIAAPILYRSVYLPRPRSLGSPGSGLGMLGVDCGMDPDLFGGLFGVTGGQGPRVSVHGTGVDGDGHDAGTERVVTEATEAAGRTLKQVLLSLVEDLMVDISIADIERRTSGTRLRDRNRDAGAAALHGLDTLTLRLALDLSLVADHSADKASASACSLVARTNLFARTPLASLSPRVLLLQGATLDFHHSVVNLMPRRDRLVECVVTVSPVRAHGPDTGPGPRRRLSQSSLAHGLDFMFYELSCPCSRHAQGRDIEDEQWLTEEQQDVHESGCLRSGVRTTFVLLPEAEPGSKDMAFVSGGGGGGGGGVTNADPDPDPDNDPDDALCRQVRELASRWFFHIAKISDEQHRLTRKSLLRSSQQVIRAVYQQAETSLVDATLIGASMMDRWADTALVPVPDVTSLALDADTRTELVSVSVVCDIETTCGAMRALQGISKEVEREMDRVVDMLSQVEGNLPTHANVAPWDASVWGACLPEVLVALDACVDRCDEACRRAEDAVGRLCASIGPERLQEPLAKTMPMPTSTGSTDRERLPDIETRGEDGGPAAHLDDLCPASTTLEGTVRLAVQSMRQLSLACRDAQKRLSSAVTAHSIFDRELQLVGFGRLCGDTPDGGDNDLNVGQSMPGSDADTNAGAVADAVANAEARLARHLQTEAAQYVLNSSDPHSDHTALLRLYARHLEQDVCVDVASWVRGEGGVGGGGGRQGGPGSDTCPGKGPGTNTCKACGAGECEWYSGTVRTGAWRERVLQQAMALM